MPYRGGDLDLKTPQGWSPSGRETGGRETGGRETGGRESGGRDQPGGSEPNWWTRSAIYKGGRADPIWVDDNVLACCNHAFDLANAHRAAEVRIEHLINAMTMNDAVAQLLEARGIGVQPLRRESGAILASEIPAGPVNGKSQPKRSEALEETLRLAADRAYPRRTPVTIDDILHVLFEMTRDLPGLQMLRRNSVPWAGRNGGEPRVDLRLEPLPHLSRPTFSADQRYPAPEEPRPRCASPPAHDYFPPAPQPPRPPMPPMSPMSPAAPPRAARDPAGSTIDALQNNRLDALDRAVRDLGLDLADDRKSLQSIVTDLQRQSASQADDTNRFRGGLSDRLNSLEDAVVRNRNDPSQIPASLLERIVAMERSIDARLSELARNQPSQAAVAERLAAMERMLDQRITEIGRGWAAVGERLQELEQLARRPVETTFPPMLTARIEAEIGRGLQAVAERLQALEHQVKRPIDSTLSPLLVNQLESFGGVEQKVAGLERTFQLILDRMTGVERQLGTQHGKHVDLAPLQARLGEIERNIVTRVSQSVDLGPVTDLLSGLESHVAGLERTLENRTTETGRTVSFIGERLRGFEEQIGGQKTDTVDRLGQIERSLTAYAERTVEAGNAHERDLSELHEALVKLNANQQTLAGSLDQWRLDNTGDLSVVSNDLGLVSSRLKAFEDNAQLRDPLLDRLTTQVGAIHNAVGRREIHKSRFRNWLYGTEEWYSASYDTEAWRARQAVDILRGLEGRPLQQQQPRATPAAPVPPPGVRRT